MTKSLLRMHKLGYWLNPFSTLTDEQWLEIGYLHPVLGEALASGRHLQLLGEKGSGKTTALHLMVAHLAADGCQVAYEHVPEGQHYFVSDTAALEVFVLDEAQRLSWWQKRRLAQIGRETRLIISSHRDLGSWLYNSLTINVTQLHTLAHWHTLLTRRLAYFAGPTIPKAQLSDDAIIYLQQRFAPDFRAAEFFLYEVWEGLPEACVIDAQMLAVNSEQ